jgi:hypothetical protein
VLSLLVLQITLQPGRFLVLHLDPARDRDEQLEPYRAENSTTARGPDVVHSSSLKFCAVPLRRCESVPIAKGRRPRMARLTLRTARLSGRARRLPLFAPIRPCRSSPRSSSQSCRSPLRQAYSDQPQPVTRQAYRGQVPQGCLRQPWCEEAAPNSLAACASARLSSAPATPS